MEGKKNPYDPAELFKQWLDNASKMQSDFTNNVNPFQANTDMFDRSNAAGTQQAFHASIRNTAQHVGPHPNPGYKDPFHFGSERYNFDRYYRHPRFSDLGFSDLIFLLGRR